MQNADQAFAGIPTPNLKKMPSLNSNDSRPLAAQNEGAGSPVRVLVIEDNDDDQQLLLRQLKKAEISERILFVNDGKKAVDILLRNDEREIRSKLVAVFLDLKLPNTSGIEILRLIRSTPEIAKLPVIVMTGSTNPKDLEECQKLKATSYISKPIAFQSFVVAIANVFHAPQTSL